MRGRYTDILKLLVARGADVDTVLFIAAEVGDIELVKFALEHGAAPHYGLCYEVHNKKLEVVKLLVEKGAENASDALTRAAEEGHTDIVRFLVDKGINPDAGLIHACISGHIDIVQLLLESGGNADDAIFTAASEGQTEIVKLLLSHGANPTDGLYGAACGGNAECLKLILSLPDINVNVRYFFEGTPLDLAIQHGHDDCAELLRAAGAKLSSEL